MENPEFESYTRPNGHDEFMEFYHALPKKERARLDSVITKTSTYGLLIAAKQEWIKKLDVNLFELRSKTGSNIQRALYFHVEGNRFVITHGFTKKTQKTPAAQIDRAKRIRAEFEKEENQ
ncbi:MAG: type II toxin-antitoxin system RelE/ParE family toxin [Lacticaseibacillus paracasei]